MTRRVMLRARTCTQRVMPFVETLEDRNAPGQVLDLASGLAWGPVAGLGRHLPAQNSPVAQAADLKAGVADLSLWQPSFANAPSAEARPWSRQVRQEADQAPVVSTATGGSVLELFAEQSLPQPLPARVQGNFAAGSVTTFAGSVQSTTNLVTQAAAVLPPLSVQSGVTGASSLGTAPASTAGAAPRNAPVDTAQVLDKAAQQPLRFEANMGQTDGRVDFLVRGQGYNLFLTPDEAIWSLATPQTANGQATPSTTVRMQLEGANADAPAVGVDLLPGVSHYLIGNDPSQWQTNVQSFGKVVYQGVYDGIDLVYYSTPEQHLEYDFVVAPHVDTSVIQLSFDGVSDLRLDGAGNLVMDTSHGEFTQRAPVLYQETAAGKRAGVAGNYVLLGENQVGFQIGAYDPTRPLVIDPVVTHSTYLGGSSFDTANDVTTDVAAGNFGFVYVTGTTQSANLPGPHGYDPGLSGTQDAFVTKYQPNGLMAFTTYLGGVGTGGPTGSPWYGQEAGEGIAVDYEGYIYVTGWTGSGDFPATSEVPQVPPYQTELSWELDNQAAVVNAFLTKIKPAGDGISYSTYVGRGNYGWNVPYTDTDGYTSLYTFNEQRQMAYDVVVDQYSIAYIVGETQGIQNIAAPLGSTPPADAMHINDAFIARIPTKAVVSPIVRWNIGSHLVGGFVGNSFLEEGTDSAQGIAIDSQRNLYVTGYTTSSDYVTTNGVYRQSLIGVSDAFVTKLNADLEVVYSTYLGNNEYLHPTGVIMEAGYAIAVDMDGQAYVTGESRSANFHTTAGVFQPTGTGLSLDGGAFLTKFNASGSQLLYSTYLGGPSTVGYGVALGNGRNPVAFVAGVTRNLSQHQQGGGGGGVGGGGLGGGGGGTPGTGPSVPGVFPVTANATQPNNGGTNAFLTMFNNDATGLLFSTFHGGADNRGNSVAVRPNGETYDAVIVGETDHLLPLVSAYQPGFGGGRDGFLAYWTGL